MFIITMKSKKTDPKNTKKPKKELLVEDEHETEEKISIPDGDEPPEPSDENPDAIIGAIAEDGDDHVGGDALVADEVSETPDEVGFDDLTDDEREMLGLEAKPKVAADDDAEESGTSWEEFGYDEEELQ